MVRRLVGVWVFGVACLGADVPVVADPVDVSMTRPMVVRAVSPQTARATGFDQWVSVLPDFPADIAWPTDPVSSATRDYQTARQDYVQANPAERTREAHALHRTRDAVLRTDVLAADMTLEDGASPWQAAIALHRLTARAVDRRGLEDPEAVQRAAVALLTGAPEHPASVHARFVLANLAAYPSLSTYDPEEALAWALDALEHDASLVPEVARLLQVLPGDLPLPDWAYDQMRPQWQADEQAMLFDATFDHAVRRGHVDDALRERESMVGVQRDVCSLPDAEYVCGTLLDGNEESASRLLRMGWTTSTDWRAHAHAAIATCATDGPLPIEATLSWDGVWTVLDAPDGVEACVVAQLAEAPEPLAVVSVEVFATP